MDSVLFGRAVDSPLDTQGELQAQLLAERLTRYEPIHVEASPRRRTQQTAAAIGARLKCAVHVAPELDEVDFGAWAGQSFSELAQDPRWREWNERRGDAQTPAGERMNDVQQRLFSRLQDLCAEHPQQTVAVVTHAEVIRSAVLHLLGAALDNYWRVEISPASITAITLDGERAVVHTVNERVSA